MLLSPFAIEVGDPAASNENQLILNPEEVMRRGYAILSGPRQVGSILQILTKDEKIIAKVESNERR